MAAILLRARTKSQLLARQKMRFTRTTKKTTMEDRTKRSEWIWVLRCDAARGFPFSSSVDICSRVIRRTDESRYTRHLIFRNNASSVFAFINNINKPHFRLGTRRSLFLYSYFIIMIHQNQHRAFHVLEMIFSMTVGLMFLCSWTASCKPPAFIGLLSSSSHRPTILDHRSTTTTTTVLFVDKKPATPKRQPRRNLQKVSVTTMHPTLNVACTIFLNLS